MNPIKVLRICGITCLLCGIFISVVVMREPEASLYSKIIGPLQIVVGALFIIISRQNKSA